MAESVKYKLKIELSEPEKPITKCCLPMVRSSQTLDELQSSLVVGKLLMPVFVLGFKAILVPF